MSWTKVAAVGTCTSCGIPNANLDQKNLCPECSKLANSDQIQRMQEGSLCDVCQKNPPVTKCSACGNNLCEACIVLEQDSGPLCGCTL